MASNPKDSHVHLNLNVRGLDPSATVSINDRSNELRSSGVDIIKLGLGQSPFPVPRPVVASLQANAHQKDYLPVLGLRELRERVAQHHAKEFGFECGPDNVLIGPGSKELMFLLQLSFYGDLVIPSPCWVSYAPQAKIIGRQIRYLETRPENDWFPTPDSLEALCKSDPGRPRLLILNYPSNPTGRTMSRERLADLADVARKNRVILLSDEIYGKLHHQGAHESVVPLYREGAVFSGGLSKWCGAGGWRLGVFVFPEELRWLQRAIAAAATETFTSTSAPIQHAAVTAFEDNAEIEAYLKDARRVLRALGRLLAQRLRLAGAEVHEPEGGFYLFPDFSALAPKLKARGVQTSREMCRRLLEDTGVAVLPGADFGRPDSELTARIAYVDFDGERALELASQYPDGEELPESVIEQACSRVIDGVQRICEWAGADSRAPRAAAS